MLTGHGGLALNPENCRRRSPSALRACESRFPEALAVTERGSLMRVRAIMSLLCGSLLLATESCVEGLRMRDTASGKHTENCEKFCDV